MKRQMTFAIELSVLFLAFCSCSHSPSGPKNEYVELRSIELFNEPIDSVAVSVARNLNVCPVTFAEITFPGGDISLLKEGYKYLTRDGAIITIWTDM